MRLHDCCGTVRIICFKSGENLLVELQSCRVAALGDNVGKGMKQNVRDDLEHLDDIGIPADSCNLGMKLTVQLCKCVEVLLVSQRP